MELKWAAAVTIGILDGSPMYLAVCKMAVILVERT